MKSTLLLLHGALGASSQFAPLLPLLSARFDVHLLDFEGHGESANGRPFRIEHFAENVQRYLEERSLSGIDIFGYSMGGYVATYLATRRSELVRRICTLGTKWQWTPEIAARETKFLDPVKIAEKVPHFARQLADRHTGSGWENVLQRTAEMMTSLGERNALAPEDLRGLEIPVRVGVGDRDTTVSVEESAEIYRLIPQGELQVLPGTQHPLEKVAVERIVGMIGEVFG